MTQTEFEPPTPFQLVPEVATNPVYEDGVDDSRLHQMSRYVDAISLGLLHGLGFGRGDRLLDLGAGPSSRFGQKVTKHGALYVAIDKDPHAVTEQLGAGNRALVADSVRLPFQPDTFSFFHARFNLSWLGEAGRTAAFREIARIGRTGMAGVISEYDWSVTAGDETYMTLVNSVRGVLSAVGFAPDYGASVQTDVREQLLPQLGASDYHVSETRQALPATEVTQKKGVIAMTTKTVLAALHNTGQQERASVIASQLEALQAADLAASDIVLPDIVSVVFHRDRLDPVEAPASLYPGEGIEEIHFPLHKDHLSSTIWRLDPGADGHPLRQQARHFFAAVYDKSGYFDKSGLNPEEFIEATDPESEYRRSDIFVAGNSDSMSIVSTIRLMHPTSPGVDSLPTGHKLLADYGSEHLPSVLHTASVGEAGFFASTAFHKTLAAQICIAVMERAADLDMEYVLIGAVAGRTAKRFDRLFGPSIDWLSVQGQPATVTVSGKGYPQSGIVLESGLVDVKNFLPAMIDYCETSAHKGSEYVLQLCRSLQLARTNGGEP